MGTSSQKLKMGVYGQLAKVGKALSSPKRLHLIDLLCDGPKNVDRLATETGMSVANTSQHLQTLLEARLVVYEKRGLYSIYKLSDPLVGVMFHHMQILGENLIADIQKLLDDVYEKHSEIEQVAYGDLMKRIDQGNITLIDVRPKEDYDENHFPGSNSVPIDELEQSLADLPRDQDIIAYCRGRYCLLSIEAVEILQKHGYNAIRFEDDGAPIE